MKSKKQLAPWLKPKTPTPSLTVGVGWYTKAEWSKVKATAVDAEGFEATYAEWVKMAKATLANLRATGITAEKSFVNSGELLAWCLAHNKRNDGAARAEFVMEQERRAIREGA